LTRRSSTSRLRRSARKNTLIDVSGLRDARTVMLSGKANINDVKDALPEVLRAWQDNPPPWRSPRLGIESASPIMTSTVSGRVWLNAAFSGGFAGNEHTVGEFVTRVLREQADVPKKLAAHSDVAERHAFIWATPQQRHGGAGAA
jgi:hypothetical protein